MYGSSRWRSAKAILYRKGTDQTVREPLPLRSRVATRPPFPKSGPQPSSALALLTYLDPAHTTIASLDGPPPNLTVRNSTSASLRLARVRRVLFLSLSPALIDSNTPRAPPWATFAGKRTRTTFHPRAALSTPPLHPLPAQRNHPSPSRPATAPGGHSAAAAAAAVAPAPTPRDRRARPQDQTRLGGRRPKQQRCVVQ